MNILQICYIYPPSFSGYGKQLFTVNKYFENCENVNIKTITAFDGDEKNENVKSLFRCTRPSLKDEKKYYYLFVLLAPFVFFIDFLRSDIVHIVKAGPEIIIWTFLSKIFNKKLIVKITQDETNISENDGFIKKIRQYTLRYVDKVVAISSKIEEELKILGVKKRNIIRINNSFDDSRMCKCNTMKLSSLIGLDIREGYNIITFVGSICKRKGVQDLLLALKGYNGNEKIILLLVGPNYNDIENFDDLIKGFELHASCDVIYLGVRDDVCEIVASSDFLCLPSYSEGMPNVVIESLMLGTPVITSNIPVCVDMVDDYNGFTFDVGNIDSLSSIILEAMMTDFDRDEISKLSSSLYSLNAVGEQYNRLYEDL